MLINKETEYKVHTLKVELTDEDWEFLRENAKYYDMSPSKLIEHFIKDLVYSKHSSGSDEEMLANSWYDRNRWNFK